MELNGVTRCIGDNWVAIVRCPQKTCEDVEKRINELKKKYSFRRLLMIVHKDGSEMLEAR